jgi:hypothetical protein
MICTIIYGYGKRASLGRPYRSRGLSSILEYSVNSSITYKEGASVAGTFLFAKIRERKEYACGYEPRECDPTRNGS